METIEIDLPSDIVERLQEYAERIGMDWKEVASLWLAMVVMQKTDGSDNATQEQEK